MNEPQLLPLAGVRVLDFSRVLAGPYCTMLLADLGADVVKIERPGEGDETRSWGPPFSGGEAAYYLAVNRGKRSVALDLSDSRAAPAVRQLICTADVVIENFRAGVAQRLGLGYDAVAALRPDVVYCSITGFGSAREPRARAGYDFVAQAECGLMSITGERDGPPTKAGVALVDVLTGVHAATGILAALHQRALTGAGRRLEVSLLDSGLAGLVNVAQAALMTGTEAQRYGNAHPSIVPYEPFETASGWIAVAAANDALWRRLCAACERPDLLADERFSTNPGRVEHRAELAADLAAMFRSASRRRVAGANGRARRAGGQGTRRARGVGRCRGGRRPGDGAGRASDDRDAVADPESNQAPRRSRRGAGGATVTRSAHSRGSDRARRGRPGVDHRGCRSGAWDVTAVSR